MNVHLLCRIAIFPGRCESCQQNVTTLWQCDYVHSRDTDGLGNRQLGWLRMLHCTGSHCAYCCWYVIANFPPIFQSLKQH